ncbi:Pyridoxine/pyridoxamine 5'-phosphate oxidase [Jeotgalicoccus saudimassiliensis]|uniref:Pyridoxine/pyridoxamine 5'-phosphate oxidase n=1 Tax=Jeotgalicoccus saudimassiliensis TaxID=1461582 RepID=A0A078M8E0_9STAP|nr:pyridoxamine 5'-phosphate oxidase family protein [Jeotgalicoccus saudimassiliensis]CEA02559.1 Pyridoxine/pyridoxamine 5'-phosphate oxidase [Jeotgalicoccus saudimassiliensis]
MNINEMLKDSKIMTGPFPLPDETVHANPFDRFTEWYAHAVENDTKEPNSMVLGTIDENGTADSRVVLLKAVDETGFYFETGKARSKVRQLAHNSSTALNIYWREQGRQIRIKGTAIQTADFSHVADNLDASVRDLNAYKTVPSEIEFYQALNEGGYARLLYKFNDGMWKCDWL